MRPFSFASFASGLTVLALGLAANTGFAASSRASTPQVEAELVASAAAIRPGDEIQLGVRQKIIPHWHTYWVNPGDSGLATQIGWTLPEGARAGDIQWPTPGRFKLGPVVNYGYENEVTLLATVKAPADLQAGGRFPVKATVDWLVCQETCIPQQVELELTLPVQAAGSSVGPGSPLIEQARTSLPIESPWPIEARAGKDAITLRIAAAALAAHPPGELWFYADQWGKTAHDAPQPVTVVGNAIEIRIKPGDEPLKDAETLSGVLSIRDGNGRVQGYRVATPVSAAAGAIAAAPQTAESADLGVGMAVLLALAGGLILNLMPCVFPVLSIKALSVLRHAGHDRAQVRLQGLAYTAGVLSSFAALGAVLIALKAGGAQVGWGFQFQSPPFVLAVAYLMFTVGLSLSGVFTLGSSAAGIGTSLADKPGYAGSFFTGVLATVVATPCTAPFMGAALGFALGQSAPVLLAVFLSLGLGLALPYLLLCFWPALQRALPRPGVWMERVKQALAFPMYAAAVWLVWVLAQQAGPNAIAIALGGMLAIAFAAWLYDSSRNAHVFARHGGTGVALLTLVAALGGGYAGVQSSVANAAAPATATAGKHAWEPYSKARFDELRAAGKPVFVNFTAAWCITCLANEKVALSDASVTDAFRQAGITYLKGDWTNQDPQISAHLAEFGRSGVPLYLLYPAGAGSAPQVLPQLLTPSTVLSAIAAAGPATASPKLAKE
ncbi:protein-disulfide reductase DsbD [Zoogloea sp. LCSB751]|uniref:protein-disulfide reductase DsbD family protein n=1 Tax=Zoogloea sp. LCSB751 TaxID=1965277 RepID=UPI001C1F797E|nr:protein-disulfide reductase DsbD domain-containing protein [Zoogloea sp. LCSB751]